MLNKKILGLILIVSLISPALFAQDVELAPGHPARYVVQPGDTLWDISERFLREPWRWPQIWEANPYIENPHLIYPGDLVVLSYRDGRPVITVERRGRPTIKLGPRVREVPLDAGAVPTIPIDAIRQMLSRPRVMTEAELEAAPYIVSLGPEHLMGGAGSQVYARGLSDPPDPQYTIYRRGEVYRDPDRDDAIVGVEALHVGDAALKRPGDPTTLLMVRTYREVLDGDRLFPVDESEDMDRAFMPRAPEVPVRGRIISVVDGVTQIGQYAIVVLNVGTADGIERGHVLAVNQLGITVKDPYATRRMKAAAGAQAEQGVELDPAKQGGLPGLGQALDDTVVDITRKLTPSRRGESVTLPEERAGVLMVFRPFKHVSYGLIMKATRDMHVYDVITNP